MRVKSWWLVGIIAFAGVRLEAQGIGAWNGNNITDGGRLSVVAPGLASTSYKMSLVGNGLDGPAATIQVEDLTPADESRYRFRFYFDTNNWDTGIASGKFRTRMLTFVDSDGNAGGPRRLGMVALRYCPPSTAGCVFNGQSYGVVTRIWDSGTSSYTEIGPFPVTPGVHYLEADWKRATGPGANNGSWECWIDGTSQGTIPSMANETLGVDLARLGLIEPLLGNAGTLYLDEFESRRQTYIGSLP